MARIGVLTGGGDCPGLDAVIRAVARRGLTEGHTVVGFHRGWLGLLDDDAIELTLANTSGILTRGGTVLGTSRTDPLSSRGDAGLEAIDDTLSRREVDALVVIGGDGTLSAARDLSQLGIPIVGVPKTIDNDVAGTDVSVGFHTAVQIATDALDRLHTTAESHDRVMVLEVMGRHAGWIATCAGMAGGADVILVPERPFEIVEVCEQVHHRHARGRNFSIVVVAEGAAPRVHEPGGAGGQPELTGPLGPGSIGNTVQRQIEALTGYEARTTVLGHVQRGGTPIAYDRMLATRFGIAAADAALAGRFGTMIALHGTETVAIDLQEALSSSKLLDLRLYENAAVFFG